MRIQKTAALLLAGCLLTGCGGNSSKPAETSAAQTKTESAATSSAAATTTAAETTTTAKKEAAVLQLTKDDEVYTGKFFCEKLGYEVELEAANVVSEDYVRRCAAQVENMSDALYDALREAAKRYCLAFLRTEKDSLGEDFEITEEYHKVTKDTPAEDIMKMCRFDTLYIDETEDESQIYFTLSGDCDWEIEHGLESGIQDGTLMYLGGFDDVSTLDRLSYYTEDKGRLWNYALTFEDLTAGIIEKIEGIEDLDKLEGVSEEEIDKAEEELKLLFPEEYRAILLKYGSISFGSHEWTGLGFEGEGNVVSMTQREREVNEALPAKLFVLENAGIDGIVIAANEFGDVFRYQGGESKKIHGSILEYLEWCLQNQ